jgi:hypothetical protein
MIWCTLLPLRLRDARSRHLLNFEKILHFPFSSIHFHQLAVSGYRLKKIQKAQLNQNSVFQTIYYSDTSKKKWIKYSSDISLRTQASAKESTKYNKFGRQIKEENNQKVLQKIYQKTFQKLNTF